MEDIRGKRVSKAAGGGSGTVLSRLRGELLRNVDEATRERGPSFFKEEVKFYGVRIAVVSRIAARAFEEIRPLGKDAIFALCEDLLKSDYGEEAFIAFDWAYALRGDYGPGDFAVFERWLGAYVNNWAKCDTLCNHTIGAFVERYPRFVRNLKGWARSENRWIRRAAAVTLILPARNGGFLEDVLKIADLLLCDDDDLVQKGCGWMLKEAARKHEAAIFGYVMKNKAVMPRTMLRYAIEKMPLDLKREAMKK
jgi:3-methyladenine DNA glycosylase AlkD